ncbi:MAG: hypothetical protein QOK24_138 [Verrucomicrobiota bacterium]|jgi:phosphatidate phosphatase APP1
MIPSREGRPGRVFVLTRTIALLVALQFPASLTWGATSSDSVLVVSDVDDTIKDTQVTLFDTQLRNPAIIFDGLRPWRPVPGMARLYQDWKKTLPAHFHYVSAGPLRYDRRFKEFLTSSGFPDGLFSLRTGGNLIASHEYKIRVLTPILTKHPDLLVLFVGDSGERDPESYGVLARRFPRQTLGILIRKVTDADRTSPRYREAFSGVPPSRWALFRQPAQVATLPLRWLMDRSR